MPDMDLARIRELIKAASESEAAEVEIEEHGVRIIVRKNSPAVALQPPLGLAHYPPSVVQGAAPLAPAGTAFTPPPPAPAQSPAEEEPDADAHAGITVEAPTPGTFYSAPSPDSDPFVGPGDVVKAGDTLCIIEAMKLMNEIECEVAGTIVEVLVNDSEPVEYGQALFVIDPA